MPTTSELDIVGERILKWFPFLYSVPCYLTIDLSACNMKGPERPQQLRIIYLL